MLVQDLYAHWIYTITYDLDEWNSIVTWFGTNSQALIQLKLVMTLGWYDAAAGGNPVQHQRPPKTARASSKYIHIAYEQARRRTNSTANPDQYLRRWCSSLKMRPGSYIFLAGWCNSWYHLDISEVQRWAIGHSMPTSNTTIYLQLKPNQSLERL